MAVRRIIMEQIIDNEGVENDGKDENQKDTEEKKKVEPKRKRTLNPQPRLNVDRLKGPRGIGILETFFQDIKLKGKGHEKQDLDVIMARLEHWAHRLYPRFKFDDCLEKIEKLGTKRPIQNYLRRIRLGMEDEDLARPHEEEEPPASPPMVDPFDELIGHRPQLAPQPIANLNAEQRERMLRNRMIAEERRMARMKAQHEKQKLQNEIILQEQTNSFPSELSQTEKNSSNGLYNRNGSEMEVDDVTRAEIQTNKNFNGIKNTESNIPLHITNDEAGKEYEMSSINQTSVKDTNTVEEENDDTKKSLVEAQKERMLQNKRRAEGLIRALKKSKLEVNFQDEQIPDSKKYIVENEMEETTSKQSVEIADEIMGGNRSAKQILDIDVPKVTQDELKVKNTFVDQKFDHGVVDILSENRENVMSENSIHGQRPDNNVLEGTTDLLSVKNTDNKVAADIHSENTEEIMIANSIHEQRVDNKAAADIHSEYTEEIMIANSIHEQRVDNKAAADIHSEYTEEIMIANSIDEQRVDNKVPRETLDLLNVQNTYDKKFCHEVAADLHSENTMEILNENLNNGQNVETTDIISENIKEVNDEQIGRETTSSDIIGENIVSRKELVQKLNNVTMKNMDEDNTIQKENINI